MARVASVCGALGDTRLSAWISIARHLRQERSGEVRAEKRCEMEKKEMRSMRVKGRKLRKDNNLKFAWRMRPQKSYELETKKKKGRIVLFYLSKIVSYGKQFTGRWAVSGIDVRTVHCTGPNTLGCGYSRVTIILIYHWSSVIINLFNTISYHIVYFDTKSQYSLA